MKLLYINTLYTPFKVGGAEKSVQILAESMAKAGHEVFVLSLSNKKTSSNLLNDVKVYYLNLKNFYWPFGDSKNSLAFKPFWHLLDILNPFMANEVEEFFEKIDPDIIHTNNLMGFSTGVWSLAKKKNKKIVHTLRDYYLLCPYTTMFKNQKNCNGQCLECSIYSRPKRGKSNGVNSVVGISEYILNKHTEQGFFKNVVHSRVIGNSVKTGSIKENKQHFEKEKKEVVRFGFLGRIAPSKGVDLLINVASNLPQNKFELLIAGKGNKKYIDSLKKNNPQNVSFIGYVDSASFLASIDYLLVPSQWREPFGRVVIEAYAQGVPVIASRRGGLSEIVKNGITGYLFEPNDHNELFYLLQDIINNQVSNRFNKQRIKDEATLFTPEKITNDYEELYNKLIDEN
jgi:glycosyltransferase involved in cell wall biosynthesis